MAMISLGPVRLHYEEQGRGEAVVLVNGIMMTVRSWAAQIPALAERYRCIAYDLRGQWLSDKPDQDYSFDDHAADLLGLLDRLDLGRVHLVGVSYGGAVAMRFAGEHSHRLRSLSLLNTVEAGDDRHRRLFQSWLELLGEDPSELLAATEAQNYSPEYIAANRGLLDRIDGWFRSQPRDYYRAIGHLIPAIRDVNLGHWLGSIECPTLVLAAARDALVGAEPSRRIAEAIPGARLVTLDTGHAAPLEAPSAVNAVLRPFIDEHSEAPHGQAEET